MQFWLHPDFTIFRFGRKKVVIIAICLVLIAGFGMVKPVVWWVYALWRTLAGMSHPGVCCDFFVYFF